MTEDAGLIRVQLANSAGNNSSEVHLCFEDNGVGGRFRTPTLRNIAVTAPYMHDGRFATLGAVIDHYSSGGAPSASRSALVRGFAVTEGEKADLIAFLESLTDAGFLEDPLLADPWKN